jgi:hypothetical protein
MEKIIRGESVASETPPSFPLRDEGRSRRYERFLEKMEKPKPGHFQRQRILDFNKKIRTAPKPEDLGDIEAERKAYVKSLFKKEK